MKRKDKTPQAPKPKTPPSVADRDKTLKGVMDEAGAREARIQSKTVGDLADMLRQIVKSRGKGENRFFAYTDHPLRPAVLDAFHLACRLDPCFKSTFTDGANERGERYAGCAVGRIAPPDPATGLKSNTLNRAAVALMNFLERLKRSEADAGENAELLAIAGDLDALDVRTPKAPAPMPTTVDRADAYIRKHPGDNTATVCKKACGDMEPNSFLSHISPALKKRGFRVSRGCTAAWYPPERAAE